MTLTFISVFLITNVSVYVSTEGSLHAPMLRLLVGHRLFSDIFLFYTHNKHRPQTCDQSVAVLLCLAWPLACTTCTHTHTHTHTTKVARWFFFSLSLDAVFSLLFRWCLLKVCWPSIPHHCHLLAVCSLQHTLLFCFHCNTELGYSLLTLPKINTSMSVFHKYKDGKIDSQKQHID